MKNKILMLVCIIALIATTGFANSGDKWADFPASFKSGIGVQDGSHVYVGLGAGTKDFYTARVGKKGLKWYKRAQFPGPVPAGASAALVGKKIYVFGGNGKAKSTDVAPILFDTAYVYNIS